MYSRMNLAANDTISIDPYTIIPCDSYIVSGISSVDKAIVTGESGPKAKSTGDFLLAGTRNGPGHLEAIVDQDQQGSFLSQLIRTVEDASATKTTVQEDVDRITQYFVHFVFLLSTVASAWLFWEVHPKTSIILGFNPAAQRIMTILSAACPCALGLATPCAIMAGIGVYVCAGSLDFANTMFRCRVAQRYPHDRRSQSYGQLTECDPHHHGQDWNAH